VNDPKRRRTKIEWLAANAWLWAGETDLSYMGNRALWKKVRTYLVAAGLQSPTTGLIDSGIDDLIISAQALAQPSDSKPVKYSARREGLIPLAR